MGCLDGLSTGLLQSHNAAGQSRPLNLAKIIQTSHELGPEKVAGAGKSLKISGKYVGVSKNRGIPKWKVYKGKQVGEILYHLYGNAVTGKGNLC